MDHNVEPNKDSIKALERDFPVIMPKVANEEFTKSYWGPKETGNTANILPSHLDPRKQDNMQIWRKEQNEKERLEKKKQAEEKAIKKVKIKYLARLVVLKQENRDKNNSYKNHLILLKTMMLWM